MWLDKIEDAVAAAGRLNELHSAAKECAGVRAGNQNSHNFAELYDRLEDEYRAHRRAETWKTIRTELKPFRSEIGKLQIEAITPGAVSYPLTKSK
jgi:hypothetical protein